MEDDEKLGALIKNVRNAKISITNTWMPQVEGIEELIVDTIIPFKEDFSELILLMMAFEDEGEDVTFSKKVNELLLSMIILMIVVTG